MIVIVIVKLPAKLPEHGACVGKRIEAPIVAFEAWSCPVSVEGDAELRMRRVSAGIRGYVFSCRGQPPGGGRRRSSIGPRGDPTLSNWGMEVGRSRQAEESAGVARRASGHSALSLVLPRSGCLPASHLTAWRNRHGSWRQRRADRRSTRTEVDGDRYSNVAARLTVIFSRLAGVRDVPAVSDVC